MYKDIKKQKNKLTIFFTILVFFLAFILEISFFSFKYFSQKNITREVFQNQTKILYQKINKQNDIIDLFENTFLSDSLGNLNNKNIKKKNYLKINYIILDNQNNIVDKKIFNNIEDYSYLSNLKNNKVYFKNDFFILQKKLDYHILGNKIIFFKKLHYDKKLLFSDLVLFFIITVLFSVIFYIFGKKFVDKTLKPVEQNITDMENFIHNSSHEFKTPLSIIYSNLQLIKAEKKYDEQLILENLKTIKNFEQLINSLEKLSGISINLKKEKIKLKKEIPEIIAENIKQIKEKNIKIDFKINNNLKIFANKQNFKILFQNLLQNAIKYNKNGGKIKIFLEKNKLIIKDSGIGIKKENLVKIFDRFYRENNSKIGEGFGIGLSLVEKIININNWKLSINSQKNKGTTIEIKF